MSIISKIKKTASNIASKVGTAIKSAVSKVSGSSQGASVLKAVAIPGAVEKSNATAIAKGKAEAVQATKALAAEKKSSSGSGNSQTMPLLSTEGYGLNPDITGTGKLYKSKSSYSSPTNTITAKSEPSIYDSQINALSSLFSGTSAPGNISSITETGTGGVGSSVGTQKDMPISGTTISDNLDSKSYLSGDKTITDLIKAEQERQLKAIETEQTQKKSLLDSVFGNQKTREEMRQDYQEQIGMDMGDYLKQRSQIQSELQTINEEYANVEAMMNQQIAQETSRFGIQDFTNNRVAQIRSNSAPQLNAIAAKANMKSAELAVLNDNWELAEKFINDAVEASVADQKDKIVAAEAYYDMYSDTFDAMDKTYKDSFLQAIDLAKMKLDEEREKRLINYRKNIESNGNIPVSSGFASYEIEQDVRGDIAALMATTNDINKIYKQIRTAYSPSEVSDATLKSILGITEQATPTIPTKTTKSIESPKLSPMNPGGFIDFTPTIKSVFSNLFS